MCQCTTNSAAVHRQCEVEVAPFAWRGLHPDAPVVRLDDALRDDEAKSDAAPIRAAALPELTEDVWQLLRGNPGTGIGDDNPHLVGDPRPAKSDATPLRSELDRIPDEIGQDLLYAYRIRVDLRKLLGRIERQLQ